MEKEKPIGVFDSGIGGLTVVKKLISTLPQENIVYFGDTARVPYGSKSNATVIEYSIQDSRFLMNKNVKAIVVACNTASSVALHELSKMFDVPIIGVIRPGAAEAVANTKNGKIGIIGTRATISNQAYSTAIKSIDNDLEVFEKACPLFVPLAEEGLFNHEVTKLIAEEYLKELRDLNIDTLVLGCTHYPLLSEVIQQTIGDDVKLIDSGIAAAAVVKEELDRTYLHSNKGVMGNQDFFVSDIPARFKSIAEMFLGKEIDHVTKVNIEQLQGI